MLGKSRTYAVNNGRGCHWHDTYSDAGSMTYARGLVIATMGKLRKYYAMKEIITLPKDTTIEA